MNHFPLISIIVPVFNGEQYIENLVGLILNNHYSNFELLICDDYSVDSTWEILQKFKNIPKVKILRNDINRGPGFSRNLLMSQASGDLIAIQDADDEFTPDRFKRQVDFLIDNPDVDIVGTAALMFSEREVWGRLEVSGHPSYFQWIIQKSLVHATIMFRKKIILNHYYSEVLRMGEDYFFLTEVYLAGAKVVNITEPLYIYKIKKSQLRSRVSNHFIELLKSKMIISKLFRPRERWFFLIMNISLLFLARIRNFFLVWGEEVGGSKRN